MTAALLFLTGSLMLLGAVLLARKERQWRLELAEREQQEPTDEDSVERIIVSSGLPYTRCSRCLRLVFTGRDSEPVGHICERSQP